MIYPDFWNLDHVLVYLDFRDVLRLQSDLRSAQMHIWVGTGARRTDLKGKSKVIIFAIKPSIFNIALRTSMPKFSAYTRSQLSTCPVGAFNQETEEINSTVSLEIDPLDHFMPCHLRSTRSTRGDPLTTLLGTFGFCRANYWTPSSFFSKLRAACLPNPDAWQGLSLQLGP